MTLSKKILAQHIAEEKTTSIRITAWDHGYLKAVAAVNGMSLTEAIGVAFRERMFPPTIIIRKNIIKGEAHFYTAILALSDRTKAPAMGDDEAFNGDFYEGPSKKDATQAAIDFIEDLGLGFVWLDYRTENLDEGTVIRDEHVFYMRGKMRGRHKAGDMRGKMRGRQKAGDALADDNLPALKPRSLAGQTAREAA